MRAQPFISNTVSRLQNYLRTHRRRFGLSQKEVAKLLGVASGTKVSRYENFVRMPSVLTVFACEIVFNQPASELFAGSYEIIRLAVQERARQLLDKLNERPNKPSKNICRKLELLHAIVEADTNEGR
jgi:transcriptional regulator with XRE-family HTH domain